MQTQRKHTANAHSKPVSLDSVFQAVEHWRKNKSKYGTHIPDSVWLLIFQLEETYSVDKIRQIFAISKKTYLNKRSELKGNINPYHSRETHSGLTNTFQKMTRLLRPDGILILGLRNLLTESTDHLMIAAQNSHIMGVYHTFSYTEIDNLMSEQLKKINFLVGEERLVGGRQFFVALKKCHRQ